MAEMAPEALRQTLLAQFRAAVADDLALLSRLHRQELDSETLTQLNAIGFPDNLGLRLTGARGREAVALAQRAMAALPTPDQNTLDALAVDFANIYLLYSYRAAPCESVWFDDERLVRQQPMFQVRSAYRRHGLVSADRQNLADDHLSLQLEFIGHLLRQTDAPDSLNEAARFMDEHLLRWVADFAGPIIAHGATPFYGSLAALTASFADELRDCLANILDQPRPGAEEIERRMRPQPPTQEAPLKYMPGVEPSW